MTMQTKNIRLLAIILAVPVLLLIPFIAMQFTNEVKWGAFDFLVAGMLLLGTGIACELVLRVVKTTAQRVLLCLVALLICFLVWAELAVGIFGTPFAGS